MQEVITEFIDAMSAAGCKPASGSDIKDTNGQDVYIRLDGDKSKGRLVFALKIQSDGFAWGNARNFKTGESLSWHSLKGKKGIDPEERKRRMKQMAKEQAEAKRLSEQAAAQCAEKCMEKWAQSGSVKKHAYLDRKNIEPHIARADGKNLLIPAYKSGKLSTIQTISEDGAKRFAAGGSVKGAYCPLAARGEETSTVAVAEGFATGATVRQATGWPVAVAFDCENLKPVAQEMRRKYPNARIIIAADNDAWSFRAGKKPDGVDKDSYRGNALEWNQWREEGRLINPGIEKGQQAAVAVGGYCVYPEFTEADHESKPTDWNDYASLYGLDAVKDKLMSALAKAATEPDQADITPPIDDGQCPPIADHIDGGNLIPCYEPDHVPVNKNVDWHAIRGDGTPVWFDLVKWKKLPSGRGPGEPEKDSGWNAKIYIKYAYPGLFKLNNFCDEIYVMKCPPWERGGEFRVRPVRDTDVYNMAAELETHGLGFNTARVKGAIESVAEEEKFHPVQDYFSALRWDGVARLDMWLRHCFGSEQDSVYLSTIGTMWMVAGVRRIFEPGTKFDHMLVLEGPTNLGKSTAFRQLATFGRDIEQSYFSEAISMADVDKKDSAILLQGKIIVEFAELDGMNKATDESLKRWITKQEDEIVKKYSNYKTKYPRQFILSGTTNESCWLRDATGNRRYWPVKCTKADIKWLKENKEQLWAEAVQLHLAGFKIFLPDDHPVYQTAKLEQSIRLGEDIWEEPVLGMIECRRRVTIAEILKEAIGKQKDQWTKLDSIRISEILKKNGWVNEPRYCQTSKKTVRAWYNDNADKTQGYQYSSNDYSKGYEEVLF